MQTSQIVNITHNEVMRGITVRTPKKRARFLEALEQCGNATKACKLSALPRRSAYDWRDNDVTFKADWDKAIDRAANLLEEEAIRRAHQGVREPVFQGGKLVGHVQKYSDTLLIFLLKGAKPDKYSERRVLAGDKENPLALKVDSADLIAKILGKPSE